MTTRLRQFWADVNASYWFYPALFALLAVLLALLTTWLDRNGFAEWLNDVTWIQPARPEGAVNMLTVISGSMIGVASTVFSITIAAVAYASGNYGPRLLTNFMEDRGNQLSLATFISTFVYAITILRVVRLEGEVSLQADTDPLPGFVPQLSLLVAYLLMALAIMVLVYFLNHIPASIRINTVLKGIGERLLNDIRDLFPDRDRGEVEVERHGGDPVTANEVGYIQLIDFERLAELATKENGTLALAVRTGDFVHPQMPIAFWRDLDVTPDLPDAKVRDCFILGGRRTPNQDMQFLIDELVEIGLRALSPGINDPFTAVTAIHWLGAAVAELGYRDLRCRRGKDYDGRLLLLDDDFAHYVERGFGAMRGGIATSRIATLVTLDSLVNAATTLDDESRRAILVRQGELLIAQSREHLAGPDRDEVEARYALFDSRMAR